MTEKQQALRDEIERIKRELVSLGPLRPGSLSKQKRSRGGAYYQLSYSHAGKGHTEYVHEENAESVRQELENYRKLRELVRKWVKLEIELSKARRKCED